MTFGHTAPSRVSSGWSSRKRTWWWAQSYVSHFQSLPCPDEFSVPQCKHFDSVFYAGWIFPSGWMILCRRDMFTNLQLLNTCFLLLTPEEEERFSLRLRS